MGHVRECSGELQLLGAFVAADTDLYHEFTVPEIEPR